MEEVEAPWFDPGRPDWIEDPMPGLEHTFRLWPHKLRGEGHFAAVLRREGDGAETAVPVEKTASLPGAVTDFLAEHHIPLSGNGIAFGSTWFLTPRELPELRGLRVLRAGLELGEVRKGRFVPAHALALWLQDFSATVDLSSGSAEAAAYLRGETLHSDLRGWVLIRVDGCGLGWAKGADGVLKNHYPKGLRRI